MTAVMENTGSYLADFEAFEKQRAPYGASWFTPLRKAAIAHFAEGGFPTLRDEDWRFTNLAPITRTHFEPADTDAPGVRRDMLEGLLFGRADCPCLVFVNARYRPELSSLGPLAGQVKLTHLAAAMKRDADSLAPHLARYADYRQNVFTALNTAMLEDGAFLAIPNGMMVEQPIHLVYIAAAGPVPTITHPRTLIVAGASSQVTIVESFAGAGTGGAYFTNAVTELIGQDNAVIDHYRLQQESDDAFHMGTLQVHLGRDTQIRSHSVSLGGALVRNNVNAVLDGEGGECTLNGLYLGIGRQHVDNQLRVEHAKPHCNSWEYYKGILADQAHGVFSGRVVVHKDAQKTDAKQTNKNLLLSDAAQIDTNPQLEILADDVKCTHAATIGQIDGEALFYLRSRGIAQAAARDLLVYAFASESINQIKIESIRARLEQLLFGRLRSTTKTPKEVI